jgi:hypothetical protein
LDTQPDITVEPIVEDGTNNQEQRPDDQLPAGLPSPSTVASLDALSLLAPLSKFGLLRSLVIGGSANSVWEPRYFIVPHVDSNVVRVQWQLKTGYTAPSYSTWFRYEWDPATRNWQQE